MSAARVEPLHVAVPDGRLFATVVAAEGARRAAVVVHGAAPEMVAAARAEAVLARSLAARGTSALRYHARGYGDSTGGDDEVTFATLVDDAAAACAFARRRFEVARVAVIGVRLGALVAAAVTARVDVAALALWEPVVTGASWLDDQFRAARLADLTADRPPRSTATRRAALDGGEAIDVNGYLLHAAFARSFAGVALPSLLESWLGPLWIAEVRPTAAPSAFAGLAAALAHEGARVTTARVDASPSWDTLTNPPWESLELAERTAEWLDAVA